MYWSATSIELDENGDIAQEYENHTIYYAKTRDFRTFTKAEVYHSGGKQEDGTPIKVIDSTMIENDGTYYRYTKNEMNGTIMVDKSDSILGNFETIDSTTLSTDVPATVGAVEGPIIFKMNEKTADGKDQWCLMVDRFARGQGYYPLITTDLDSGEFTMLSDDQFSMPTDVHKYRHGYVMPVTAAEYDALQRTYGDDSYVSTYKLEQTIASAEAIDQSLLTEDSAAALQSAIADAKAALGTVASTADADAAAQALQDVIAHLEYTGEQPEAVLTGISVTAPTATTYTVGDELNLEGLEVTAFYSDNTSKDVTAEAEVDTSACQMDKAGTYTVTVSYKEGEVTKTDSFEIIVKEASVEPGEAVLTGISVTAPTATTYTVGDELNLEGLKVTASYSDNTSKDVTAEAEVDTSACQMDKAGTYTVTVSYKEGEVTKTDSFEITVKAAEPTAEPTGEPTEIPTQEPTKEPTQTPTQEPSKQPTGTQKPSGKPGTSVTPGGTQGGGSSAATGDTSNMIPAAAALTLAAGCAAVLAVLKRRKKSV